MSLAAFTLSKLGTSDQALITEISTIAGVIGSGIGAAGGTLLNAHFPTANFWKGSSPVARLLRRKLESDFKHSFLQRPADFYNAAQASEAILNSAKVTMNTSRSLLSECPLVIPSERLSPRERAEFERVLGGSTSMKVNCAAMFPASLAVLLSMKDRLKDTVPIDLTFSDLNSHEQFDRASHGETFDFMIAAEGPFFLATGGGSAGSIDPQGLTRYARVLPCNIEWQHLFLRKGSKRPLKAHVYQASSAELQFRCGLASLFPGLSQDKLYLGVEVAKLAEKNRLSSGECVIAWEPLSYVFERSGSFTRVPKTSFQVWISLFCNAEWLKPRRRKRLDAFRQLFVDEWKYLRSQSGHADAMRMLIHLPAVLESFALSSGFTKDGRLDFHP